MAGKMDFSASQIYPFLSQRPTLAEDSKPEADDQKALVDDQRATASATVWGPSSP
mgnify:CR=1 FL=1